jgi:hypothetical protein
MRRVSHALVYVLALVPTAAFPQDYFGAIAYSSQTGAHGWAKDYPSRDAAQRAALSICRKHASDCRAVLWFRNACGALARGPNGPGWAWAESQVAADKQAMELCAKHSTGCSVTRSVCTKR